MNSIEIEIKLNHTRILSDLNSKLEKFFEDTKSYISPLYIIFISYIKKIFLNIHIYQNYIKKNLE